MRFVGDGGLRPWSSTLLLSNSHQSLVLRRRIINGDKPPLKLQKKYSSALRNSVKDAVSPEAIERDRSAQCSYVEATPPELRKRWEELQGLNNWAGLLNPLDDHLRREILRYGLFVDVTYRSFDFGLSSPTYATCLHPKRSLLARAGVCKTGYKVKRNLFVTSGVQLPSWIDKAPSWMAIRSSWIGYVAVCQNKEEIARLGRRDVVIALRGTATCLEWIENVRASLTDWPGHHVGPSGSRPMVESGFLSLYTSRIDSNQSLQEMVREEVAKVIKSYGDKPLSLTITGHSLGAALAILCAYDITSTFPNAPMVTVISFAGPRVGNQCFRSKLEKGGTRVLRIVNSDDLITKVPGFAIGDDDVTDKEAVGETGIPRWIKKLVEEANWVYADVGQELRVSSRESPYFGKGNVVTCHDLKTYLELVKGCFNSTCPRPQKVVA